MQRAKYPDNLATTEADHDGRFDHLGLLCQIVETGWMPEGIWGVLPKACPVKTVEGSPIKIQVKFLERLHEARFIHYWLHIIDF